MNNLGTAYHCELIGDHFAPNDGTGIHTDKTLGPHQNSIQRRLRVNGTTFAATITNVGSIINLTGGGLGQKLTGIAASPNTGVGSDNGNATISFGGIALTSFTFTYLNTPGGPNYQEIAISKILFTPYRRSAQV